MSRSEQPVKIIDISIPLDEHTPAYPGDVPFRLHPQSSIHDGEICNLSSLTMSAHSGTHIDAPYHFVSDGKTVDALLLDRFWCPARVVTVWGAPSIDVEHLQSDILKPGIAVLFKTVSGADDSKCGEFSGLTVPAAERLRDARVNIVGIDRDSIEGEDDPAYPVHRTLLGGDVIILERVRLDHVGEGTYRLACFPLLIKGADGSPVRAVLFSV
ncbi:MAG: cyclase family protein [Chlorobi bacterium]|nr:cyclase family protein [Chlorobiota bacterium]